MASYPSSQSYGGLGNYAGSSQQDSSSAQKSAQIQIGLSSYGQSLSSEQLDLNNLGSLPSYHQYSDLNDPQLLQQVDQIVNSLIENKRPMLRRQVITVPASTPGRVACITRRLPTPPPDIIERITVVKPPRDVINLCIEKPYQPGPCYQERNICGKPRKPVIQPRVVQVPPRSAAQSQPAGSCPPCPPCPPSAQIQIFAGPQSAAFSGVAAAPSQPTQTLQQQAPTQSYALPASSGVPQQAFSGYGAPAAQPNYNLPQQAPQLPPPQAAAAYASAPYQQQYQQAQQPPPQFSAPFAQQQAQYGQQPIYQTPDALQQTQSQTGFNPQQPVYANNFPGGYPAQQQGYPQQAY